MAATDSIQQTNQPPINRTWIYVSLALALALVVGVLVGSKMVMQKLNNQPVALSEVPAPLADSPECAALIDASPGTVNGHSRSPLADPAPAGAAVWQSSSTERVTLRCGVDKPLQFTELTPTTEAGGAQWIKVADLAPEADLATWFTVDRTPVVAVTGPAGEDPTDAFDLSALKQTAAEPAPAPLSELEVAEADNCAALIDAFPDTLADRYQRIDTGDSSTAAWSAEGLEPVVVRCGVAPPASYAAGAALTQVNDIPWFEETETATSENLPGTVLYALGRDTDIALYLPPEAGEGVLSQLSELISGHVPAQN